MDDMRIMKQGKAIPYKGKFILPLLYYRGNSDRVHSWDITVRGFNLSRATEEQLATQGLTLRDIAILNQRVQADVNAMEGPPINEKT